MFQNNLMMECTQRLEYTQDLYGSQTEKIHNEQIGFLGINSMKYPVMKGPNKIGRDPQSCSIVISQNCISRHHAVINVLNHNSFMIMDLDSTSKTKLYGKNLKPYIPHPLQNGDILEFGNVVGIFRLLEEESDLPMTQAIDIPETPVQTKFLPRPYNTHTVIPESPDVSDRDDSLLTVSQPKHKQLKNDSLNIHMAAIGFDKTKNTNCKSANKSNSIRLSMNESSTDQPTTSNGPSFNNKNDIDVINIHDMETQPTFAKPNEGTDIFTADTEQINKENYDPDSIHSMNTQLPSNLERLPASAQVSKNLNQNGVQLNLYATNEVTDDSIFDAATQLITTEIDQESPIKRKENSEETNNNKAADDSVKSNVTLEFEEIDSELLEESFESQSLIANEKMNSVSQQKAPCSSVSRKMRILSYTEKLSQSKIPEKNEDDDSTDCEDNNCIEFKQCRSKSPIINSPTTEKGNKATAHVRSKLNSINKVCFEEMLTQVIGEEDEVLTQVIELESPSKKGLNDDNIEDAPTQIILEVEPKGVAEEPLTQQYSEEIISPFKVPLRFKTKPSLGTPKSITIDNKDEVDETNDKYYQSTQEVMSDLCSQTDNSPTIINIDKDLINNKQIKKLVLDKSSSSSESEDRVNKFVTSLTKDQITNMIGVDTQDNLNKSTDSSDVDCTPKKVKPLNIMDVELPNTQEIKECLGKCTNQIIVESSSDSEIENYAEELCDPFLLLKRRKKETSAKMNLNDKFEDLSTKTRRTRKPTAKLLESCENNKSSDISITDSNNRTRGNNSIKKPKQEKSKNNKRQNKESKKNTSSTKLKVIKSDDSMEVKELTKSSPGSTNGSRVKKDNKNKQKKLETAERGGIKRNTRAKSKLDTENESNRERTKQENTRKNGRTKEKRDVSVASRTSEVESENYDEKNFAGKTTLGAFKIPLVPERVRSTRSMKKDEDKIAESESESKSSVSVRRSKRQLKSILKNSSDQSVVYDAPSSRPEKRPAHTYSNAASSKRSRPDTASPVPPKPTLALATGSQRVLFTAFANEEVQAKLENLGASIVSDVYKCTVVLTFQIKRTFKLLCAVGLGRPVVGPAWVQACADARALVDPWLHLLKDETAERRFRFSLHRTLTGKRNFLKRYNVSSTPSVLPSAAEMKLIVECSGGAWREGGRNWVCVTSAADRHLWPELRTRGATLVSTEFILEGVLRQSVNIAGTSITVNG